MGHPPKTKNTIPRIEAKSLRELYPDKVDIPLCIAISFAFLWQGLTLPIIHVEKMVLWESSYSVTTGVYSLFEQKELLLGSVLFFFSFVFPIVKLLVLLYLWLVRLTEETRERVLHWLGVLGKWSMLDVFVVAILIVAVKLGPLADVQPRRGIYFFCLAILCSMLTTMRVEKTARGG